MATRRFNSFSTMLQTAIARPTVTLSPASRLSPPSTPIASPIVNAIGATLPVVAPSSGAVYTTMPVTTGLTWGLTPTTAPAPAPAPSPTFRIQPVAPAVIAPIAPTPPPPTPVPLSAQPVTTMPVLPRIETPGIVPPTYSTMPVTAPSLTVSPPPSTPPATSPPPAFTTMPVPQSMTLEQAVVSAAAGSNLQSSTPIYGPKFDPWVIPPTPTLEPASSAVIDMVQNGGSPTPVKAATTPSKGGAGGILVGAGAGFLVGGPIGAVVGAVIGGAMSKKSAPAPTVSGFAGSFGSYRRRRQRSFADFPGFGDLTASPVTPAAQTSGSAMIPFVAAGAGFLVGGPIGAAAGLALGAFAMRGSKPAQAQLPGVSTTSAATAARPTTQAAALAAVGTGLALIKAGGAAATALGLTGGGTAAAAAGGTAATATAGSAAAAGVATTGFAALGTEGATAATVGLAGTAVATAGAVVVAAGLAYGFYSISKAMGMMKGITVNQVLDARDRWFAINPRAPYMPQRPGTGYMPGGATVGIGWLTIPPRGQDPILDPYLLSAHGGNSEAPVINYPSVPTDKVVGDFVTYGKYDPQRVRNYLATLDMANDPNYAGISNLPPGSNPTYQNIDSAVPPIGIPALKDPITGAIITDPITGKALPFDTPPLYWDEFGRPVYTSTISV